MKRQQKFELSIESVEEIMKKHRLGDLVTITIVEKGLVNPMYQINGKYMLRLHIREPHLLKLEKEAYIYDLINRKSKVKIPVPEVLVLDTTKTTLPCNYSIMNKIKGEDLDDLWPHISQAEKRRICFQLGKVLAKLHNIEMREFGGLLKGTDRYKDWYSFVTQVFKYYMKQHRKYGIIPKKLLKQIDERFKKDDALFKVDTKPVVLHGDCQRENIKVFNGRISGIFDFEWSIAGHNEFDFKGLMSPTKKNQILQEEVIKGYQSVKKLSKDFRKRVKLYIILNCLDFLEAAHIHWEDDPETIEKYIGVIEGQLA